jgi:tmRNA-binding protein
MDEKLLLHKNVFLNQQKYISTNVGFVKIEIALCKYKKLYDRREEIKQRELNRELQCVKKRSVE